MSIDVDSLSKTIEIIAAIGGLIAAFGGTAYAIYIFCRRRLSVFCSLDAIYNKFGDSGFHNMVGLLQKHQEVVAELQARQLVTENQLSIGIYICDTGAKCVWSNSWLNESFGLDSTEMLGWGWLAAVLEEDRIRVYEVWSKAVASGFPYSEEYTVVPLNGAKPFLAKTEAWPAIVNGKIVSYVGSLVKLKDLND